MSRNLRSIAGRRRASTGAVGEIHSNGSSDHSGQESPTQEDHARLDIPVVGRPEGLTPSDHTRLEIPVVGRPQGLSPSVIFSPVPGVKGLKLDIEKYEGRREAAAIQKFLIGLEDLLEINGINCDSGDPTIQKSAVRLSRYYLIGQAQAWYDEVRKDLDTFEQFKEELKHEFIPATELESLGQQFYRASQTRAGKTRPVGELATELKRISNLLPTSSISLYVLNQRFLDAMDPELRNRVRPLIDLQASFKVNTRLAERYDSSLHAERLEARRSAPRHTSREQPRALDPRSAISSRGPTRTTAPRQSLTQESRKPEATAPTRLSNEERERRRRERLCYYCGEAGHNASAHSSGGGHLPVSRLSHIELEKITQPPVVAEHPVEEEVKRPCKFVQTGRSYAQALASEVSGPVKEFLPAAMPKASAKKPAPLHHDPIRIILSLDGHEATVGFDTECSTVLMDTKFASLHNLSYTVAEHKLQLGVNGSKGTIKGIRNAKMSFEDSDLGSFDFALASLPGVDAYIGMPVLRAWGAVIDIENRLVRLTSLDLTLRENLKSEEIPKKRLCSAAVSFEKAAEELPADIEEEPDVPSEALDEKLTDGTWFTAARKALEEEYRDVLVDRVPADWVPPLRKGLDHEIPIIDQNAKYPSRPSRIPLAYRQQVQQHWEEMSRLGTVVHASDDKQSSPLFTVPKKDASKAREVYDLRARNDNTLKQQILLPSREEVMAKLARATHVSKFDLPDCFLQFRVAPEDVKHTTVSTPYGQFRMLLMQMGDTNAPATCQRAMNKVTEGWLGKEVICFLDDGWIATSGTKEKHLDTIKAILQRFRDQKFLLSRPKSAFFMDRTNVLGFLRDNVKGTCVPQASKVQAILNYPTPRNANEVSAFLGAYNFITQYAGPYGALIGANITPLGAHEKRERHKPIPTTHTNPELEGYLDSRGKFKWTSTHAAAFEKMKQKMVNHPYMVDFNQDVQAVDTYLLVDACLTGTGGCIAQASKGAPWYKSRPTHYFSKAFTSTQMNYAVHELETLGLFIALKNHQIELRGRPFTVLTDNDCLMRLNNRAINQMTPREIRMMEFINEFDVIVRHIPGSVNTVADAISRISGNAKYGSTAMYSGTAQPEEEKAFDLPVALCAIQLDKSKPPFNVDEMMSCIPKFLDSDSFTREVVSNIKKYRDFRIEDKLLVLRDRVTGKDRVIIPRSATYDGRPLAWHLISLAHHQLSHLGVRSTLPAVRDRYYWPGLAKDVYTFVQECEACQQSKVSTTRREPPAHSLEVPLRPWRHVALDFVGPLPEVDHPIYPTQKVNSVLVVLDRLTSYTICLHCRTDITAEKTAELMRQKIYPLHGLPDSLVSDRDPRFTSEVWTQIHAMQGIELRHSTSFHPRTDGQVERTNRTMIELLRANIGNEEKAWALNLPQVNWSLNTRILEGSKMSPYHMLFGLKPSLAGVGPRCASSTREDASAWKTQVATISDIHAEGRENIITARIKQDKRQNKTSANEPSFKKGDLALLSTRHLKLPGESEKLKAQYIGPFKIVQDYKDHSTYKLQLPKGYKMHNVFHASRLKKIPLSSEGKSTENYYTAPREAQEANEFEVEQILGEKKVGSRTFFKVKWLGWESPTWEPTRNLKGNAQWETYMRNKSS